jgi:hypothetical protein
VSVPGYEEGIAVSGVGLPQVGENIDAPDAEPGRDGGDPLVVGLSVLPAVHLIAPREHDEKKARTQLLGQLHDLCQRSLHLVPAPLDGW